MAMGVGMGLATGVSWGQSLVLPADVQAAIRGRITNGFNAGIMVGLVSTNGTQFFSFGSGSRESSSAVTEDTVFEVGSITKIFTCTILSDLVERGSLTLATPVQSLLPSEVRVPTRNSKAITLGTLAMQNSGLPRLPTNLDPAEISDPYADYSGQNLYDFLNGYVLPRDPGATYEYSNLGVGLLGYALSLWAGTNYESLVLDRIAQPLGLEDTVIRLSPDQSRRSAQGYTGVVPVGNWTFQSLAGAGALRSTARDLSTFLAANMGLRSTALLPAMVSAQKSRSTTTTGRIGLGWQLLSSSAGDIVWHDGGTGGFASFIGFLANKRLGVVLLANSDYPVADLGFHLLDPAIPLSSAPAVVTVPPESLNPYVGRYQGRDGDEFNIALRRDHLTVAYSGDRGQVYTLYPSSFRTFFLTQVSASATFQTNAFGVSTNLRWTQGGVTSSYPRLAVPPELGIRRENSGYRLTLLGDPSSRYVVERSTDLLQWIPVSTNSIGELAPDQLGTDLATTRFFRLR